MNGVGVIPTMLVSLSAPKLCAQNFVGIHYLGGRFIPPGIEEKYSLGLPDYPGSEQVVRIDDPTSSL